MGSENERMKDASFNIVLEGNDRAFSCEKPIIGVLEVDSEKAIPAYGIEIALIQVDLSHRVDRGDKG